MIPRVLMVLLFGGSLLLRAAEVRFERLPGGAIQPQVATDHAGTLHVTYFSGDAMGGDIFYISREAGSAEFSKPLRVNHQPGSAIAAGIMRGPQMALGKDGRVHVAWMGGNGAAKVEVDGEKVTPLLYARMSDDRKSFDPEKNLVTWAAGLDGGGTVAADQSGNVWVIWHGAPPKMEGEENRAVYISLSKDEGKTFAREFKSEISAEGACACCGLKAFAQNQDSLYLIFRPAIAQVNRPELLLHSNNGGKSFTTLHSDPWKTSTCPATSASILPGPNLLAAAWESNGNVHGAFLGNNELENLATPKSGAKKKNPVALGNKDNEMLLLWNEGAGWGGSGNLCWQLFKNGKPAGEPHSKPGLPAWSYASGYTTHDGNFVVLY